MVEDLPWADRCGCCHHPQREAKIIPALWKYPLCMVCEQRMRNGLVCYRPSNGSEFYRFYDRCCRCRHYIDNLDDPQPGKLSPPFTACTWGVLDRLHVSMIESDEHISNWFDPADLDVKDCPATCLRFTHRNDPDGETRDPPPPLDPKQLTFEELLSVPERELVHA